MNVCYMSVRVLATWRLLSVTQIVAFGTNRTLVNLEIGILSPEFPVPGIPQLGPRLLRNFMRDTTNQVVL
ncbi:DUF2254 domain-containing protein, partial [Marinobacterium sedimentorum]|uniref:DUF2254 domain-containing protein n=1 Tax=Marinobacterium sedimentorum TaxID=2927804 RepID=UPI0020C61194